MSLALFIHVLFVDQSIEPKLLLKLILIRSTEGLNISVKLTLCRVKQLNTEP